MQFNPLKSIGLAKLLEGKGTLDDAVFLDEATGLYVLPQRPDDNSTVSLADSPAFSGLLDDLRDLFDLVVRSEEHTSELQSLMRNSYAVFCLKKTQHNNNTPRD